MKSSRLILLLDSPRRKLGLCQQDDLPSAAPRNRHHHKDFGGPELLYRVIDIKRRHPARCLSMRHKKQPALDIPSVCGQFDRDCRWCRSLPRVYKVCPVGNCRRSLHLQSRRALLFSSTEQIETENGKECLTYAQARQNAGVFFEKCVAGQTDQTYSLAV
jgi:hypothetical protein